jgi:hypothetical protein
MSLARSVASGVGLAGRIKSVQLLLSEMRAVRPGIVRVLDSVGVRVVTPWSRDREALIERAPRSFEFAMGGGDRPRAWHATIAGPGGFAVMLLIRKRPPKGSPGEAAPGEKWTSRD